VPVTGLTPVQQRVLDVIRASIATTGVAPTYDEMAAALGRGVSTVHRSVHALAARGHIRTRPGASRAIELVDDPYAIRLQLQPTAAARLHRVAAARGQRPEALVGELVAEFLRAAT
jgi:SOS-response transcriptional repressor LexA